MEEVRDFFISKKGAFTSFTWENPNDSTEYTVRFLDDAFKQKRVAFNVFSFNFEILEVRA
jgi:phage-related protein